MERWVRSARRQMEVPEIDAFLDEVIAVCKKHGMSISHEDGHGAFEITAYDETATEWLRGAHDDRKDETAS